jgi:SynChlorMet cassette radical SAM/SPASM protein ScmF
MGCEPEPLTRKAKPAKPRKLDLPPGVPPLTSLYMYISGSCNLACRHCWIEPDYQADNKNGKFLKLEFLIKAIKEAKPLGLQSVKLTGGEPLLHPRFCEIVEHLDREGVPITIETNGTLIDKDMAEFLKSKSSIRFISVSLDGANAKTHDELRGISGSFIKALAGIILLKKSTFSPQIICTLHRKNLGEIEDVIKLAKKIGCGSVKFNHVQNIGRGGNFDTHDYLQVEELISLYQGKIRSLENKSSVPIYFDIPMAFHSIGDFLKNGICKCNIFNILGILSQGDISLCGVGVTIPELIYGNILSDKLKDIWINSNKLKKLRQLIPNQIEGICKDCIHLQACMGTCIAQNFNNSNKLNSSYYFCNHADSKKLFPKERKFSTIPK